MKLRKMTREERDTVNGFVCQAMSYAETKCSNKKVFKKVYHLVNTGDVIQLQEITCKYQLKNYYINQIYSREMSRLAIDAGLRVNF